MKLTAKNSYITLTPENTDDYYFLGIITQKVSHEIRWAPEDENIGMGVLRVKDMSIHVDNLVNYLVDSRRR